jgi:hypothetical protein
MQAVLPVAFAKITTMKTLGASLWHSIVIHDCQAEILVVVCGPPAPQTNRPSIRSYRLEARSVRGGGVKPIILSLLGAGPLEPLNKVYAIAECQVRVV